MLPFCLMIILRVPDHQIWPISGRSSPMIGMAAKNRHRSVKLLADHRANQLMRPSHCSETEDPVGPLTERGGEPVRPPDENRIDRTRGVARAADVGRPFGAARGYATLIERNQHRSGRRGGENRRSLFLAPILGPARP